ncbi:shikimate kinase [Breznakiellaceae bacterium SP9]
MDKFILLTGPKHAGKTSAGKQLAGSLNEFYAHKTQGLSGTGLRSSFIDLDVLIESQTGQSPRSLFKAGPQVFRAAEERALASLLALEGSLCICAAGGGLIDNGPAIALLAANPQVISIYLDVSPETAWARILRSAAVSGELPPFLQSDNPQQTHAELHTRRAQGYKELAAVSIQGDHKSPQEIAEAIIAALLHTGAIKPPS